MVATSRTIRTARVAQTIAEGAGEGTSFTARQAQVAILAETILRDGQPELHADSTALCSHFKLRKGSVEGEFCEAQVYRHDAGVVIRFWVQPGDFSVKVRDFILLPTEGKGWDTWLDTTADGDGGKLFPHSGKYLMPALKIMSHVVLGR